MSGRPILYFTLRGLSEREAALFKSFVRIIEHRTHHQWVWRDGPADLLVLHDESRQAPAKPPMATLEVGMLPRRASPGCVHLTLPFRTDEVEDGLNLLGGLLVRRKALALSGKAPAAITAAPLLIRLRRWPPQQLLAGPHQIRLAALMTGQPITFASLCKHSGLARETCASFVRRLGEAGLLQPLHAVPKAAATPQDVPDSGVLARIRRRLELLVRAHR